MSTFYRVIFVVLTGLTVVSADAQTFTRSIWNGHAPGAKENAAYKSDTMLVDEGRIRMARVVNPVLDGYLVADGTSPHAAIVICPGGGYSHLAIDHEGVKIAEWFNNLGINAFVLKYRMPNDSIMADKSIGPLQDAQEAIRIVRRNAATWGTNPAKIGVMGFSAGGHLAATVSTRYADKVYVPADTTSARPDFSILVYPVISMDATITHMGSRENLLGLSASKELLKSFSLEEQVTTLTPPAFLVHALDDGAVSPENSIRYALALRKAGIPVEVHLYEKGGHGFGLGRNVGTETFWPDACVRWLKARGIL